MYVWSHIHLCTICKAYVRWSPHVWYVALGVKPLYSPDTSLVWQMLHQLWLLSVAVEVFAPAQPPVGEHCLHSGSVLRWAPSLDETPSCP